MRKIVRVIVCIFLLYPFVATAEEQDFDLNDGNYLALVKIDDKGEMAKRGKITVPYFISFAHNPDTGNCSGSMVRTELIFNKKGKPIHFGLAHYSVINVKIRNEKKIKFDVVQGDTTIMKKVKGSFGDVVNTLTVGLRNKSNKKFKQTFMRTEHVHAGIFLGDMTAGTAPSSPYYPRTGNAIVCMQVIPQKSTSVAGTPSGNWLAARIDQYNQIHSGHGTLYDTGKSYWGKIDETGRFGFAINYDMNKLGEMTTYVGGEKATGTLTNMGGNGKDPKFPDERRIIVRREERKVFVVVRNPQNIDPGFIVRWEEDRDPDDWGIARADIKDFWIDKNGNKIYEKNLSMSISVYPTFKDRVTFIVINPDGTHNYFEIDVDPYSTY